ncbi:MAG: tol-pal system YbgF family protein [Isosphaerales bacterium]
MIAAITAIGLTLWLGALPAAHPAPVDHPQVKSSPKDDPLVEARKATDREDWDEAAAKFRAFLDSHPGAPQAPEARFWAGFCLVKLGESEQAVEILNPFTDALAEDKWADDALLQIGKALRALGKESDALATWKRHLQRYPQSVWRTEVTLAVIDLLFYRAKDLTACLSYCSQLTQEVQDRDSTTEARYLGAYCLNALRKFDDSMAWADRLFDPESPLEEAWRRLLGAQRDLLRGQVASARGAMDSLATDFPDLDDEGRQDLLLKTTYVLRKNGRADRARELLQAELLRSSGRPEDQVESLLDELEAAFGDDHHADLLTVLNHLSRDLKAPVVVRVSARDRHAQALTDDEHPKKAEAMLREALAAETGEFPRCRAAMKLAEILADDLEKPDDAVKLLDQLRTNLKRRDLINELHEASARYRKQAEGAHK